MVTLKNMTSSKRPRQFGLLYHSKYFAHELTRRVGADQADKLAQSLSNATVDLNPHQVVICSYQFARTKAADVRAVPWDLVVIDEAHRLRNVYRKDNKIARALRDALHARPKLLLTATPLQNSLMELYGLVTFVDEHVFGSEDAFCELYGKKSENMTAGVLANLRARLAPICQRTLRKQVTQYVTYTRRIPITEDFTPSRDEQRLYDMVSAFLQKENLHSLPNSQRQLIELVLRKILASSSFAIAATLGTMIERLRKLESKAGEVQDEQIVDVLGDDFESADETEDEWNENATDGSDGRPSGGSSGDRADAAELVQALQAEAAELMQFKSLAESIQQNAKGESLLKALRNCRLLGKKERRPRLRAAAFRKSWSQSSSLGNVLAGAFLVPLSVSGILHPPKRHPAFQRHRW